MTAVSASTSQVTLIVANVLRTALVVFNQTAQNMYISTVNGFIAANAPNVVSPNDRWDMPVPYSGIYYAMWDAPATGQALVSEVT